MLLDRGGIRTSVLTYHTPETMLVRCSRELKRVTAEAFVTNLDQAPLMNKSAKMYIILLQPTSAAVQNCCNVVPSIDLGGILTNPSPPSFVCGNHLNFLASRTISRGSFSTHAWDVHSRPSDTAIDHDRTVLQPQSMCYSSSHLLRFLRQPWRGRHSRNNIRKARSLHASNTSSLPSGHSVHHADRRRRL
jgi:hypothetical protein